MEEDVVSTVGRTAKAAAAAAAARTGSLASPSIAGYQRHLRQRGRPATQFRIRIDELMLTEPSSFRNGIGFGREK